MSSGLIDKKTRGSRCFPFVYSCRPVYLWFLSVLTLPIGLFKFSRAMQNLNMAFPEKGIIWRVRIAVASIFEAIYSFWENMWLYKKAKVGKAAEDKWKKAVLQYGHFDYAPALVAEIKEQNRPLVILTGHLSDFVAIVLLCVCHNREVGVFLKKVRNSCLEKIFHNIRISIGMHNLYVDEKESVSRAAMLLKNNGIVIALLDQHFGRETRRIVKFFGKKCAIAPGILALADKFSAKVICAFVHREKGRCLKIEYGGEIKGEGLDMRLQKFTDKLEEQVRRYPSQWTWMHRRWKEYGD